MASQPPMIADELRRQADVFTDLIELQPKLGRNPADRPAIREPRQSRRTVVVPARSRAAEEGAS